MDGINVPGGFSTGSRSNGVSPSLHLLVDKEVVPYGREITQSMLVFWDG